MRDISYTDYSGFATGDACKPGSYHIVYCERLVHLIVHTQIDFYDLSEHLDGVIETDYLDNGYISIRVNGMANGGRPD